VIGAPCVFRGAAPVIVLLVCTACLHRPTADRNVIVVGVTSGPNNLDFLKDVARTSDSHDRTGAYRSH
jgi:hypothetical protein